MNINNINIRNKVFQVPYSIYLFIVVKNNNIQLSCILKSKQKYLS